MSLHPNLPIVYIILVVGDRSEQECCSPRVLRRESCCPARPSPPLFLCNCIWLHIKHQCREGWTLSPVLDGPNLAALESGYWMLRNEFPVALLAKLELVSQNACMGSRPSVCRSKYTVFRALAVTRRRDSASSLLISDLCAHCDLPPHWIGYRSVSSDGLQCLGQRIEATNIRWLADCIWFFWGGRERERERELRERLPSTALCQ